MNAKAAFLAAAVLLWSCEEAPAGPVRQFKLEGVVVRVDPARKVATVKHGAILDESGAQWMEPMTMEYPVPDPQDLEKLRRGYAIRATVHSRASDDEYWLSDVSEAVRAPLESDRPRR